MLNLFKFKILVGNKVFLDYFSPEDITEGYIGWLNDPEVVRFSNQRFIIHTNKSCKNYLCSFKNTDNLFLKVIDKEKNEMIGTMTAYYLSQHKTIDVGILIGKRSVWGKGYGGDAWCVLIEWLGKQPFIRKITAGTMRPNQGMIRVIEKSGMTLEAIRPRQELLDGQPQDLLYYGKFTNC